MQPIEFQIGALAFSFPQPWRVDCNKGLSVHFEMNVDAIASRPRYFADYHPFGFRQRIDERAFADVAASHDGQLHLRRFDRFSIRFR